MGSLFDTCRAAASGSPGSPMAIHDYKLAMRCDLCWYCGGKSSTLDHIIAASRGGTDAWENRCGLCARCNSKKGTRSVLAVCGSDLHRARWQQIEQERANWTAVGFGGAVEV